MPSEPWRSFFIPFLPAHFSPPNRSSSLKHFQIFLNTTPPNHHPFFPSLHSINQIYATSIFKASPCLQVSSPLIHPPLGAYQSFKNTSVTISLPLKKRSLSLNSLMWSGSTSVASFLTSTFYISDTANFFQCLKWCVASKPSCISSAQNTRIQRPLP